MFCAYNDYTHPLNYIYIYRDIDIDGLHVTLTWGYNKTHITLQGFKFKPSLYVN